MPYNRKRYTVWQGNTGPWFWQIENKDGYYNYAPKIDGRAETEQDARAQAEAALALETERRRWTLSGV